MWSKCEFIKNNRGKNGGSSAFAVGDPVCARLFRSGAVWVPGQIVQMKRPFSSSFNWQASVENSGSRHQLPLVSRETRRPDNDCNWAQGRSGHSSSHCSCQWSDNRRFTERDRLSSRGLEHQEDLCVRRPQMEMSKRAEPCPERQPLWRFKRVIKPSDTMDLELLELCFLDVCFLPWLWSCGDRCHRCNYPVTRVWIGHVLSIVSIWSILCLVATSLL